MWPDMARHDHSSSRIYFKNTLQNPVEIARARFIEIPALHQAGLYHRQALLKCAAPMPVLSTKSGVPEANPNRMVYRDLPQWPVDYDFWMRWCKHGLLAGKLAGRTAELAGSQQGGEARQANTIAGDRATYEWRQHASNGTSRSLLLVFRKLELYVLLIGTRWQGRCSMDAFRACKAHYLIQPGGPLWGLGHAHRTLVEDTGSEIHCTSKTALKVGADWQVELWSRGATLQKWAESLLTVGVHVTKKIDYKPGSLSLPTNKDLLRKVHRTE